MKCALWTPLAELELEDILFYIRVQDGRPETAHRLGEEIFDLANQYAARGLPGHKHSAAPDGWFYIQHKRWLIFYQAHDAGIEVMRLVDAARDLPSVLNE
jgi:plasmid stabilization system protein ParE